MPAQLDPFVDTLLRMGGTELELAPGQPVTLRKEGMSQPMSTRPLTAKQVEKLLAEIAPAGVASLGGSGAEFDYSVGRGRVRVRVRRGAEGLGATIGTPPSAVPSATADVVDEPSPGATTVRAIDTALEPSPELSPMPTPEVSQTTAVRAPETESARLTETASVPAPQPPAAQPAAVRPPDGTSAAGGDAGRQRLGVLLRALVEAEGSDLHLRVGQPPIFRTHGALERRPEPPLAANELEAILLSIMPERNRDEWRETGDTDFAYEIDGLARFRVNAARDRNGPAGVLRVIPMRIQTVEELKIAESLRQLCTLSKGLVLVTGATGSGKSTTLAALIDLVNRTRADHIITIEDPIEFVHENQRCLVTQREVNTHTGSFKRALRAALREDPDIVLVGELRDLETIEIAIETAETGHLVFGTLHTTTAASTVDRVIDQFPQDRQSQIRVMLSESLRAVVAQTLCKRIGGGRVAARETLLVTPAVSNLIREGKTFQIPSVIQTSRKLGMATLNDALLDLVEAKAVTPEEAYFKAVDKPGMLSGLNARGHKFTPVSMTIAP